MLVDLGERRYPIRIADGLLARAGEQMRVAFAGRRIAVLSTQPVFDRHGAKLMHSLEEAGLEAKTYLMADREEGKSFGEVSRLLSELASAGYDRSSVVVAFGGGALGDAAGFVASLYLRGVDFVQIPTTLLAMVDSSVGGKTGINLPEGKNLVGAFYQPKLVLIDPSLLGTLPRRQFQAGVAEIIKYGAIADRELFMTLRDGIPSDWGQVIRRCCEIKARVVEKDEYERGSIRAILNFGHTIGHALEASAHFGDLLHGEAVAIGMIGAAYLSAKMTGLSTADVDSLRQAILRHSLPVAWPSLEPSTALTWMGRDKKSVGGQVRFVLLRAIGEPIAGQPVPSYLLGEAMDLCRGSKG